MEFHEVLRRRKMIRSFRPDQPQLEEEVSAVFTDATHIPTAGFSQGVEWLVLTRPEDKEAFFTLITTPQWRATNTSHRGMQHASAVGILLADERRYVERYRAPDKKYANWKSASDWPAPFWYVDAGAAMMTALLSAVDHDLGASVLAIDRGQDELRATFSIPEELHLVVAVLLGIPAESWSPGSSSRRSRRNPDSLVHRHRYERKD
ncbi:MAG: nitroreductase family protein [Acidimicrobiales bacterium]